ncbi:MAG TPA: pyridoxamine 5'-phosphate oxidase family protein [Ktedonobacteraceae bacterium]|nr:pyridoxamine 5'-phosphate oxidase family protein [Ktedonobacteraceae bacterium]
MDERSSFSHGQYQARIRWNTQASGAAFDRKKRSFLNAEAQAFLAQRVMCVLAGMNEQGSLSGQLIFGPPGFAQSPEPSRCLLDLDEESSHSDWLKNLHRRNGGQVGLFFISHATRQRLCVHGQVEGPPKQTWVARLLFRRPHPSRLGIRVQQAFFHCPRYIRTSIPGLTTSPVVQFDRERLFEEFQDGSRNALSGYLGDFLRQHVSCFLCTANRQGVCSINHRGGAPGFLTALSPEECSPGGKLLLPDYKGNGAFEAIGNILETGLATIIVPDYSMQVALTISGLAQILEPDELPPDLRAKCIGAERVVSLAVQRVALQSGDWTLPLAYEQATAQRPERQGSVLHCSDEHRALLT